MKLLKKIKNWILLKKVKKLRKRSPLGRLGKDFVYPERLSDSDLITLKSLRHSNFGVSVFIEDEQRSD